MSLGALLSVLEWHPDPALEAKCTAARDAAWDAIDAEASGGGPEGAGLGERTTLSPRPSRVGSADPKVNTAP